EVGGWEGHGGATPALAFAPDGKTLASCAWDGERWMGTVRLWDVASGRQSVSFVTEACRLVAFSGDGKRLFAARRCRVEVWDPARAKLIQTLQEVPEAKAPPIQFGARAPFLWWEVVSFAPSPDGKMAAAVFRRAGERRLYL